MDRYDAVIVGAGAAGLSAATCAASLGARVLLLDCSDGSSSDSTELPRPRDQIATKAQPQFVSIRSKIALLIKRPTAVVARAPE